MKYVTEPHLLWEEFSYIKRNCDQQRLIRCNEQTGTGPFE